MRKLLKKITAIAVAAAMMVSFAACGSSSQTSETSSKTDLKVGVCNLLSSVLDPSKDSSGTGFSRAGIGQSLMICNTEGKLVPWLAKSIETEDSIHWTITLPDGIKFSNGNVCDAEAVKASLQYLIDNNKGLNKSLNIKSMEANGSVLALETNSVTVDLKSYLSHPQSAIQDVSVSDIANAPVGTGPYKVESFISKQQINLSKNTYYSGTVPFETVTYYESDDADAMWLQLQSGDIDMVVSPSSTNVETVKNDATYAVAQSSLTTRDRYVIYNLEGSYTSNVNFRKGIDALIDRNTIVNSIMGGLAVAGEGCIPAGYSATPEYVGTTYDINKALDYFKAAGLTVSNGKVTDNGATINLKFHSYSSFSEMNDIVQLIQSSLASVGINAVIGTTSDDIDDYLGETSNTGNWDISMAAMFAVPRGDAAYILNTSYDAASQYNYSTTRVADDTLQNMIESIKTTIDSKAREELIKKAALRVEEQCYASYYMNPTFQIVYNKTTIDNVTAYGSEQYFVNDSITAK